MISAFIMTLMLNVEEPKEFIQLPVKTEARRRYKEPKGRKRGGSGLR